MRVAAALAGLLAASAAIAEPGDWFAQADRNGDGRVTRVEFKAWRNGQFDRLDRNRDGVVSPADFPWLARLRPEAFARLTAALAGADRNGDGAVSRAELAAAPLNTFDRLDTNHDGVVTRAEAASSGR